MLLCLRELAALAALAEDRHPEAHHRSTAIIKITNKIRLQDRMSAKWTYAATRRRSIRWTSSSTLSQTWQHPK